MISVNPTYGFFDPIKSAKYRVKAKKNIMTKLSSAKKNMSKRWMITLHD